MKDKVKKALAAAKGYFARAKQVITHFETTVKAAVVASLGGGVQAVWNQYHATGHIIFSVDKFIEMKAHFLSGAFLALVFWLTQSPALKQTTPPQP